MSVLNIPCSNNYTQTQACQAAFTSTSVNGNLSNKVDKNHAKTREIN